MEDKMEEQKTAFGTGYDAGLTKLEYAAIEIAKGLCIGSTFAEPGPSVSKAVRRARLVIQECNQ